MADAEQQRVYNELRSQPIGDDYSGDGYEQAEFAFDVGLSFYQNITAMYQGTLNLFAAGLFHVIEQQLADLTRDGAIGIAGSDTKLEKVTGWYKLHFRTDLTQFPSWSLIHEVRLVANTTKHAEGSAAKQLRTIHPELFQSPLLRKLNPKTPVCHTPLHLPLGGDGLYVTEDDFRRYHKAAVELFDWLVEHFQNHAAQRYPQ